MRTLRPLARGACRRRPLLALRLRFASANVRADIAAIQIVITSGGDSEHAKTVKRAHAELFPFVHSLPEDMDEKIRKTPKQVTVSERNLQNAAIRLLPKHNKLVSTEVDYLRRVLGEKATQVEIDEKVIAVRKLPWSAIVGE